jgi:hypothetical protein
MECTVSNFGKEGGSGELWGFRFWCELCVWYTFFCLTRLMILPGIFESGEKIDLDYLALATTCAISIVSHVAAFVVPLMSCGINRILFFLGSLRILFSHSSYSTNFVGPL